MVETAWNIQLGLDFDNRGGEDGGERCWDQDVFFRRSSLS